MLTRTIDEIIAELRTKPIERSFAIDRAADVDEEAHTVSLAFASDRSVEHWFGNLELSMKSKAMRTERLDNGAPLLMDHNTRDVVGVIESHSIDGGTARAVVRFGESTRAQEIFNDVRTGIRRNVSVGFMVHEMTLTNEKETRKGAIPQYRSDDWEPYEVSIVSVPADISVGVGREFQPALPISDASHQRAISPKEENKMTPEEIAAGHADIEVTLAVATIRDMDQKDLVVVGRRWHRQRCDAEISTRNIDRP